jgi:hypothetical protein
MFDISPQTEPKRTRPVAASAADPASGLHKGGDWHPKEEAYTGAGW